MKTDIPSAMKPARFEPRGLLASAVGALLLAGCATLPDAGHELAVPVAQQVEFHGAQGPVSEARSDAILEQMEGSHGARDVLQTHVAREQAINALSPLVLGNKLTLLENGPETYAAMFAAIRQARDHINLETFIFDDDAAGEAFSDLLLLRQAAGVQVNIIYDGIGSLATPKAFFDRMRAGGIHIVEFNPLNPLTKNTRPWLLNNRDHRKLMVVDGRIAFVGGINISDAYSSAPGRRKRHRGDEDANPKDGWRDTHVRIEGPVVAEFQKLFIATWNRQHGDSLTTGTYFPELKRQGDEVVRAIASKPDDPQSLIFLTLMSAIGNAEHTVHLTVAYFAPDPQLLKALTDAARRGVEVKLVLPSYSDSWPIFNLGRSYYSALLRGGVQIHELHGAVMHAKTMCIDGVWSSIGSTNLDTRSFLHNDEINAVILGRGFATQMDAMFLQDLKNSEPILASQWKQRPLTSRLKERAARLGAYWL